MFEWFIVKIIFRFVLYLCFAVCLHGNTTPANHTALTNYHKEGKKKKNMGCAKVH